VAGINFGSIVFLPVRGSIDVMKFCNPMSNEKQYLPVSASTAS